MKATLRHAALLLLTGILGLLGTSQAAPIKTDIVFMIDATSSMAGEIAGVRGGFSSFVGGLNAASVDARFAVVVYGGEPELTLDFTSDSTAAQTALNNIVIGSNTTQNNHNSNPEAGLEAIRMALGAAAQSNFANNHISQDGILNYRNDARINLILATDENSDCPYHDANDLGDCIGIGNNNSLVVQTEVDAAAQAVIDNQAFVNMLINRNDTSTRSQYGDPDDDVADANLLNFDPTATLTNLQADLITANSLQAQVLDAGLVARSFDVGGANNAAFVENFFAAKVQEIVEDPGVDPNPNTDIPEPGTLALLGLGLAGIGFARKKKQA